jgi:hypothetical protein
MSTTTTPSTMATLSLDQKLADGKVVRRQSVFVKDKSKQVQQFAAHNSRASNGDLSGVTDALAADDAAVVTTPTNATTVTTNDATNAASNESGVGGGGDSKEELRPPTAPLLKEVSNVSDGLVEYDDDGVEIKVLESEIPDDEAYALLQMVKNVANPQLLSDFGDSDLETLVQTCSVLRFADGTPIINKGENATFFFILLVRSAL